MMRDVASKQVTGLCKRCGNPFTYTMTTKPTSYDLACRAIVDDEIRLRTNERSNIARKLKRAEGRIPPKSKKKKRRLIPYAGYDGSEDEVTT
jgi:hypothetical protein